MTPGTRATLVVALFAFVPALVIGAVALFVAGAVAGAVAFVVLAGGLAGWARFGADRRVQAAIGGREANPLDHARLWNLTEGLSISAGVRTPRLRVIDSDALNALAAGTAARHGVVGVTSGLLAELDRVELEAVLAEELIQIRRSETLPMTILAATFGLGRWVAVPPDRDTRADLAAVELTRYPPALAAALEKMEAKGSAVPGKAAYLDQLWLADPVERPTPARGRLALSERIEALREL